jgi:hypothetical protein
LVEKNAALPGMPGRVEIQLWLRLKAELADVDEQIQAAEAKVPEQRKEIEKLTEFITEGNNLRARADEKYRNVRAELDRRKEVLKAKQAEAKDLEKKIVLSHSVTPMGKLVSLSRASLEREARWIDSLLRTGPVETNEDLDLAVDRGKSVLSLKGQIEQERERIYNLRMAQPGVGGAAAPPASFDGIWSKP